MNRSSIDNVNVDLRRVFNASSTGADKMFSQKRRSPKKNFYSKA